jgi:hypothetical protein
MLPKPELNRVDEEFIETYYREDEGAEAGEEALEGDSDEEAEAEA